MKKCFPLLLAIFALLLVIQAIITVFTVDRSADYVVRNKEEKIYRIQEDLTVVDGSSFYDITISDEKNNLYSLSYADEFNKQSEIIADIREYKQNGLTCILPIYKRKKTGELSCIDDGRQVNYSYLKQINSQNLAAIVTEAKSEGYSSPNWDRGNGDVSILSESERSISLFADNLIPDYTFLLWRYRGLYILKKGYFVVKDYIDHDQYDNSTSALVDKYYLSMNTLDSTIDDIYYYNVKDMGKGSIPLPDTLYKGSYYFNGVFDDKLYITDTRAKIQYTVDPIREKVSKVGNENDGFIDVVDGKEVVVPAAEFLANPVSFEKKEVVKEIMEKYGQDTVIHKQRSFYYFLTSDGKFYRASVHEVTKQELLFQLDNVREWRIKNGDMFISAGTGVYFFNDKYGLLTIANNPELSYNYNNIIEFYKE